MRYEILHSIDDSAMYGKMHSNERLGRMFDSDFERLDPLPAEHSELVKNYTWSFDGVREDVFWAGFLHRDIVDVKCVVARTEAIQAIDLQRAELSSPVQWKSVAFWQVVEHDYSTLRIQCLEPPSIRYENPVWRGSCHVEDTLEKTCNVKCSRLHDLVLSPEPPELECVNGDWQKVKCVQAGHTWLLRIDLRSPALKDLELLVNRIELFQDIGCSKSVALFKKHLLFKKGQSRIEYSMFFDENTDIGCIRVLVRTGDLLMIGMPIISVLRHTGVDSREVNSMAWPDNVDGYISGFDRVGSLEFTDIYFWLIVPSKLRNLQLLGFLMFSSLIALVLIALLAFLLRRSWLSALAKSFESGNLEACFGFRRDVRPFSHRVLDSLAEPLPMGLILVGWLITIVGLVLIPVIAVVGTTTYALDVTAQAILWILYASRNSFTRAARNILYA